LLEWARAGQRATLLCYGQTGTGKTFTVTGALSRVGLMLQEGARTLLRARAEAGARAEARGAGAGAGAEVGTGVVSAAVTFFEVKCHPPATATNNWRETFEAATTTTFFDGCFEVPRLAIA
jgi:hypothetical protein